MAMSIGELEHSLRTLRLSGMRETLEARALQVSTHEMDFIEAFSWLVQDELDRRRTRCNERRYSLSGLPDRKRFADLDWTYNPRLPKRDILELGTLKFIDAREDVLLLGKPGTAKSHVAKALGLLAVERGYRVFYREAHQLIEDITEARELGALRKYRSQLKAAEMLLIDDLFLKRLPANASDELADIIMSRYEKGSTVITSNRPLDDWGKLLGDVVLTAPLLDRLMHHSHLLDFQGKSWRLKEAAERVAKRGARS
jgi:DNA replication protein DnaC